MEIITQAAWGGKQPKVTANFGKEERCYVHHTAGYYPKNQAEEVQQMKVLQNISINTKGHQDIEYNWVIGPSGIIYEARGLNKMSAATQDENDVSRSICVMGNYQKDPLTALSVKAVIDCIKFLIDMGNLQPARLLEVLGHRDNPDHPNATACPGQALYDKMPYIRKEIIGHETPTGGPMKDRLIRQKGYANIFKIGGGENPLALSGEMMTSIEAEFPDIPKIYQDHMISFKGICVQAGLNPSDQNQVIPYPNDPGKFE